MGFMDGGKTYKVTLPANIPAAKFWSFTVERKVWYGRGRGALRLLPKLDVAGSNPVGRSKKPEGCGVSHNPLPV
jgi:hypothetical protein